VVSVPFARFSVDRLRIAVRHTVLRLYPPLRRLTSSRLGIGTTAASGPVPVAL
jgi:hypothetical protein